MNTNMRQIDKSYVSDHDAFLHTFDQTRDRSLSQQAEFDKHHKVQGLRDGNQPTKSAHLLRRALRFFWPSK